MNTIYATLLCVLFAAQVFAQSSDKVMITSDGQEIAELTQPFGYKSTGVKASQRRAEFNNISVTLPMAGFLPTDTFDIDVAGAHCTAPLWHKVKTLVAGETATFEIRDLMHAPFAKSGAAEPQLADRVVVHAHRYNRQTQTTSDHVCVLWVRD